MKKNDQTELSNMVYTDILEKSALWLLNTNKALTKEKRETYDRKFRLIWHYFNEKRGIIFNKNQNLILKEDMTL